MLNPVEPLVSTMNEMAGLVTYFSSLALSSIMAVVSYREFGGIPFLMAYFATLLVAIGLVQWKSSQFTATTVELEPDEKHNAMNILTFLEFLNTELARLDRRVSPRRSLLARTQAYVEAEMASRGRHIDPVDSNVVADYLIRAPSIEHIRTFLDDTEKLVTSPLN